jgi:uroporphyrinogen decarboxylase
MGIDVFHPFQFSCPEMEPESLKKEYGKDLAFWGGVDVQKFLPNAKPPEIKEYVKKIIDIMGKDGGYIFGPCHNIQPDIPPENIMAMYEAAKEIY